MRLHASVSGTLASYLSLTVQEGTSGTAPDCSDFAYDGPVYDGTLDLFAARHHNDASAATSWQALPAATKTYRFAITVQDVPPAQSGTATAAFTWEAQTGTMPSPTNAAPGDDLASAISLPFPIPGNWTVTNFDLEGATFEQWED